jgi:putative spermidine/putrescine transport system permease protein
MMQKARTQRSAFLLMLPAGLLLIVFMAIPYLNIFYISFRTPGMGTPYGEGHTLMNYGRFFGGWFYPMQLANTLWIGLVTTFLTLVIGLPVAFQLGRADLKWRGLAYGIVLSPLLVGIVIRSYGWTILLGNNGVINRTLIDWGVIEFPLPLMYNSLGIIIALTHVFLPFMILPIMGAVQSIDPALTSAARSLGASRWVVVRRILLPLAMPGIQAGCILVFVLSLSAYVTPAMIGGFRVKTMAVTVVDALLDTFQWPFGAALALMLSAIGAVIVVIFARMTRMKWKAN